MSWQIGDKVTLISRTSGFPAGHEFTVKAIREGSLYPICCESGVGNLLNVREWEIQGLPVPVLPSNDLVNHPDHYTSGGIETIDFIEAKGLGYNLGNAVKYISRSGKKSTSDEVIDLKKAIFYLAREVKRLESE